MTCKPIVILEGEHFNVAQCAGCKRIGLYYKNLLIGFEPKDFKAFGRSYSKINFNASAVMFPDGFKRIVIDTCHHDIQFNFTGEEFEEFKDMLQQAIIMVEAHQIIRSKN